MSGEEALNLNQALMFRIETSIRIGEKELGEAFFLLDDDEALFFVGTEQPVAFDYKTPDHEETDESER